MYDVKSDLFRYNLADRFIKLGLCEKGEEDALSMVKNIKDNLFIFIQNNTLI